MKRLFIFIIFFCTVVINAQIAPILDHAWTIEQIDTGSEILTADLNPFGEYDNFLLTSTGIVGNTEFYYFLFGNCEGYLSFDDSNSTLFYHFQGCTLSDDSSLIANYFNDTFMRQNTNVSSIDFGISLDSFGPLTYNFTTVGDIIYLHITNSIGEVATFYATNLSQENFLKESISVYPNPVSDQLNINIPDIPVNTIKIYDLSGRLVEEVRLEDNQINVSHLQGGIYILGIETSVGVLRKKLVKE